MFEAMRRQDRELTAEETDAILKNSEHGVLAVVGRNGYPHPVPVNYVYYDGAIWIHSALEGAKLEDIRSDNRVSFCVVGRTELLPEKFSTKYESAIVYGQAEEVSCEERRRPLMALIEKYSPGFLAEGMAYIERAMAKTCVLRIAVERKTGKARR